MHLIHLFFVLVGCWSILKVDSLKSEINHRDKIQCDNLRDYFQRILPFSFLHTLSYWPGLLVQVNGRSHDHKHTRSCTFDWIQLIKHRFLWKKKSWKCSLPISEMATRFLSANISSSFISHSRSSWCFILALLLFYSRTARFFATWYVLQTQQTVNWPLGRRDEKKTIIVFNATQFLRILFPKTVSREKCAKKMRVVFLIIRSRPKQWPPSK